MLLLVPGEVKQHVVVGDQGVHAIDRDEVLGDGVRRSVVRGRGPGDTAEHLAGAEPPEQFLDPLPGNSEPVRPHADLQCRVAQNCRRPLDRVDLRDQRSVDQACLIEEQVVRPCWVRRLEPVTDCVVLAHEDG